VLGGHGLDTSEIRARAKAIAEHSNSSNTLTAEFAAPILPDIKDDPITTLYNNSVQSGKHHEGPEAMKAIVEDMQKLEAKGYERITPEQMTARISEFTAYGENVLNQMPEANAVVLHGSYLRGKPTAGDLDIRIAVEHSEPNPFDMDSAGYDTDSPTQASARSRYQEIGLPYSDGDIKSLVPVNGTIDGRPLQVHFDSHYSSGLDTGMGYAETSPYLAMVRQQDGTFALFYNNAGESYLRDGGKP
jgi:hypothetical protein